MAIFFSDQFTGDVTCGEVSALSVFTLSFHLQHLMVMLVVYCKVYLWRNLSYKLQFPSLEASYQSMSVDLRDQLYGGEPFSKLHLPVLSRTHTVLTFCHSCIQTITIIGSMS